MQELDTGCAGECTSVTGSTRGSSTRSTGSYSRDRTGGDACCSSG